MRVARGASILSPILALGFVAIIAAIAASAQPASDTRPVTLVVPIAPGGGVDTIGRVFAAILADRLKQPWVVENRPGAGGAIGIDSVAKATPDGHTTLMIETSAVLQKWLHRNVPFDVVADFAPVGQPAQRRTPCRCCQPIASGVELEGADCLRESQSRQAFGGYARRRHAASSGRRHAQRRRRNRYYPRAV